MIRTLVHAITFTAIAAAFGLSVSAHDGSHERATGVVKERMDGMESMGKHLKAISDRIKSKSDLAAVKADAEAIATLASHVAHLFPPGSSQPPTQARKEVWQNWPDFERKALELEVETKKLVNANPDNFAALRNQFQAVSQVCDACHEKYRLKK